MQTAPYFNFQFQFILHSFNRGYDPSDMELVNTENKVANKHTNNIHDVRYNTVNFSLYLDRQHSVCNVTVESYISYGVQYNI
jgi:hypothetical protein